MAYTAKYVDKTKLVYTKVKKNTCKTNQKISKISKNIKKNVSALV